MLRPNDKIGQYQLLQKLGNGAFGEVWRAVKADALVSAEYAIKFALSDDVDLDAIKREAEVWKLASGHQNIIPIIEASIYSGQLVIVSEFARDGSLQGWLKRHDGRAPSVEAAVAMTDGILAGLEHLHALRVIHRDLKPDNVLLQGATPRLADFGLSRVLKSSNSTNHIAGTIPYMSPETFKGDRSEQADLWATAVILYQLLSGRLPFVKAGQSPSEMMFAILTAPPHPLPASVPAGLQRFFARSFEKEPAQRFASAQMMRAQLRQALQPEPATIIEPQPKPRPTPRRTEPVEPETIPVKPKPRPVEPAPQPQPVAPKPAPLRPQAGMPKSLKAVISLGLIGALSGFIYWASNSAPTTTTTETPTTTQPANGSASKDFTETVNGVKLEMKAVPAGSFLMGSPASEVQRGDDEGQHRVTVSAFAIGKYEIKQAQWQAVMGSNPSNFKGANRPVEQVSWEDATAFCKKLSQLTGKTYRLPTEAEWEYAARAGTTTPFAFGSSLSSTQANFDGNYPYGGAAKAVYREQTTDVGSFKANAFGLFDMHGNVWEWCQDWYAPYGTGAQNNPTGPTTGEYRVLRGGSWLNHSRDCRAASRHRNAPGDRSNNVGFRVVQVSRTP